MCFLQFKVACFEPMIRGKCGRKSRSRVAGKHDVSLVGCTLASGNTSNKLPFEMIIF